MKEKEHMQEPTTRDLTRREVVLRAESLNVKERSVEGVIASEERALMFDFREGLVDEILLMEGLKDIPRQLPLLDTHDRFTVEKVLGSTRNIHIDEDQLLGKSFFSSTDEGQSAFRKVEEGHITAFSIGYSIGDFRIVPAGKTEEINGREFTAGERALRVVLEWRLIENSLTPIGADATAKVRSQSGAPQEEAAMDPKDKKEETPAEEQRTETPSAPSPEAADAGKQPARSEPVKDDPAEAVDMDKVRDEARAAEQTRIRDIEAAGRGAGIDEELVERAIKENKSVDQASSLFLGHIRDKRTPAVPGAQFTVRENEDGLRAIVAGLSLRAGILDDRDKSNEKEVEMGRDYQHLTMLDVCREAIRLEGGHVSARLSPTAIIERAISTLTLPKIFSNVASKALLRGFNDSPNTSLLWVSEGNLKDFKITERTGLLSQANLEELIDGGEIKNTTVEELSESYQLKTFAQQFGLTRQDIINDDLGAFDRTPRRMGNAASRLIDDRAYGVVIDNAALGNDSIALFATGHNNLLTGAGSDLDADSLSSARTLMRNQTGDALGAISINIEPMFLIVPPSLEDTALRLIRSQNIHQDSAEGDANVHLARFRVIVEPRLENTTFNSGASATAWFLAASPSQADTIEVGFLNGIKVPSMRRIDVSPGYLGVVWEVFFDVEAKALDFRGLVKANGA